MVPGTAATVLGTDVDELRDRQVSLSSVWGSRAASLADRLAAASSTGACRAILAAAVRERVAKGSTDDQVVNAARLLSIAPMGVTDLAEQVCLSDRQLRRRFVRQVGYGPKTYERVMRFRRFQELGAATQRQRVGLAHLAVAAGYADQAHLTRECRRLGGSTPTQFLDSLAAPSGSDGDDRNVQDGASMERRSSEG
jgi:transcriptional regulator GlxA family with amidase domain